MAGKQWRLEWTPKGKVVQLFATVEREIRPIHVMVFNIGATSFDSNPVAQPFATVEREIYQLVQLFATVEAEIGPIHVMVFNIDQVARLFATVEGEIGPIHVMVFNIGASSSRIAPVSPLFPAPPTLSSPQTRWLNYHVAQLFATEEAEIGPMHVMVFNIGANQVAQLFATVEKEIGPVRVVVFNIGANVKFDVVDTTSRVYFKVWEMACLAGFLTSREAARRMLPRNCGTIILTGATASVRGAAGFSAFAGAKHALRALAQCLAKELGPQGVHVCHVVIDGAVDTPWIRGNFPEMVKEKEKVDGLVQPDDVAELYWSLHMQKRSGWAFEVDLRPWTERCHQNTPAAEPPTRYEPATRLSAMARRLSPWGLSLVLLALLAALLPELCAADDDGSSRQYDGKTGAKKLIAEMKKKGYNTALSLFESTGGAKEFPATMSYYRLTVLAPTDEAILPPLVQCAPICLQVSNSQGASRSNELLPPHRSRAHRRGLSPNNTAPPSLPHPPPHHSPLSGIAKELPEAMSYYRLTVLAPTDEAFAKLSSSVTKGLSKAAMRDITMLHIVKGRKTAATLIRMRREHESVTKGLSKAAMRDITMLHTVKGRKTAATLIRMQREHEVSAIESFSALQCVLLTFYKPHCEGEEGCRYPDSHAEGARGNGALSNTGEAGSVKPVNLCVTFPLFPSLSLSSPLFPSPLPSSPFSSPLPSQWRTPSKAREAGLFKATETKVKPVNSVKPVKLCMWFPPFPLLPSPVATSFQERRSGSLQSHRNESQASQLGQASQPSQPVCAFPSLPLPLTSQWRTPSRNGEAGLFKATETKVKPVNSVKPVKLCMWFPPFPFLPSPVANALQERRGKSLQSHGSKSQPSQTSLTLPSPPFYPSLPSPFQWRTPSKNGEAGLFKATEAKVKPVKLHAEGGKNVTITKPDSVLLTISAVHGIDKVIIPGGKLTGAKKKLSLKECLDLSNGEEDLDYDN
ncbi:unnamed protein product [Closterium sp. NIES-65]|nr:unnamed protein product [Closterium sp. NIES-65]